MTSKHLLIGGSTAARTLACPAWVKRNEYHKPSNRSNTAADEGNLLHDAMENYYDKGESFISQVGNLQYKGIVLTKDHMPLLRSARKQVEQILDKYDVDEFFCEPFVQYETDRIGGSIDMLAISQCGTRALIIDYKFGQTLVKAENNAQLKFYAMSAANDQNTAKLLEKVTDWALAIIQPKCSDQPDIWECSNDTITDFEIDLLNALEAEDKSQTGAHCKYCPVAPYCPDKKAEATKALILSKTSATSLGQAWQLAQDLKQWIKEVEAECKEKLSQGADIPDLKLVAGRRIRTWSLPAADLQEILGPDIIDTAPLSPAKAEKLFGKEKVADLIKTTEGAPVVAHVTDKKDAIVIDAEEKLKKLLK